MVEVRVDADLGTIRVHRVVNTSAAGRIINPKTAEKQLLGAVVWGIGMALRDEAMVDPHSGRIMNANLAEYHVAVNADVRDIDIIFMEEKDEHVNPLGAKGVGELGIGALEEIIEAFNWTQFGVHAKHGGLFNVYGYLSGLLDHMVRERFFKGAQKMTVFSTKSQSNRKTSSMRRRGGCPGNKPRHMLLIRRTRGILWPKSGVVVA